LITSSAVKRNREGTGTPGAFAISKLTTISNLVGSRAGRSAGWSQRRMRSTYDDDQVGMGDVK
jgi:hypothetical protein